MSPHALTTWGTRCPLRRSRPGWFCRGQKREEHLVEWASEGVQQEAHGRPCLCDVWHTLPPAQFNAGLA